MIKKFFKHLTNNIGLKILALVASGIIWLVVVNINDPEVAKQFSCTVVIENDQVLAEMGKTYEVVDGSTAVFTVRANRSVLNNLSNSDFKAVANMENLEDLTYVPIEITATRNSSQVQITKRTQNVEIAVEDIQSGQYIISAQQEGTPADGCIVGTLSVSPNVLKVSGPESIVSQIDKVVATINVDDMTSDVSDGVIPVLYDADGNVINTTKLSLNLTTVTVTAQILNVKEVGISFHTTGTMEEGYHIKEIEHTPDTIEVMGESAVLNALNEISVPEEVLDVTGVTDDLTKTIDITAYLPSGVSLVNASDKNIEVTVSVETAIEQEFEMPTANITVTNLPGGTEAVFEEDTVTVKIKGYASELADINESTLTGSVDVSGQKVGCHVVALDLNLNTNIFTPADDNTVTVVLQKATEDAKRER